jgi:hypothetical protein
MNMARHIFIMVAMVGIAYPQANKFTNLYVLKKDTTKHSKDNFATFSALADTANKHRVRLSALEVGGGVAVKVNKADSTLHRVGHYATRSALTDTAYAHHVRLVSLGSVSGLGAKVNKADSTAHSGGHYASRSALTDTSNAHHTRLNAKMDSTKLKDIVPGFGISGGTDDVLPGIDSDVTVSVDTSAIPTDYDMSLKANISTPTFTTSVILNSEIWKGVQPTTYVASTNERWLSLNAGGTGCDTMFYKVTADSVIYWLPSARIKGK